MVEPLPVVPAPLTQDRREQGVELLRRLVSLGKLDLATFDSALGQVMSAATEAEFVGIVNMLPSPISMTPPERRLTEPLTIKATTQNIRLRGRWQVAKETTVKCVTGNMTVDLTEAEFDDRTILLTIKVVTGNATVVVPRGVAVQLVGETAAVKLDVDAPVPGYPLIRLTAGAVTGKVRVRHPKERRRWWRGRDTNGG